MPRSCSRAVADLAMSLAVGQELAASKAACDRSDAHKGHNRKDWRSSEKSHAGVPGLCQNKP